jgi:hypothetical protein
MSTKPVTFIACPYCAANVQATVLGEREYGPGPECEPNKYVFVECATCHCVLVGWAEWEIDNEGDEGWGRLIRQWPEPDTTFHSNIPKIVRRSLDEARRCLDAKAFTACAVMCGRAIEGLCKDKVNAEYLSEGLKKLKAAKVIDEKLFEWGEALRNERNIGAHAGEESISKQDAKDVMDFAVAMAEYVYVLDDKYKAYKARKNGKKG